MGALAWLVAPWLAHHLDGPAALPRALILMVTAGLVWQFLLVLGLVYREQRSLRWSVLKDSLWLHAPRSPKTGRRGGRAWLITIPLVLALAAEEMLPTLPTPGSRDMGLFLESHVGHTFLSGNWGWLVIIVALQVFNTVPRRGAALPRPVAASDAGRVRSVGLGRQRCAVRRLPPARAVGDPAGVRGHVRPVGRPSATAAHWSGSPCTASSPCSSRSSVLALVLK
jgi:hypothetical protein